jgi:hypothetical protein
MHESVSVYIYALFPFEPYNFHIQVKSVNSFMVNYEDILKVFGILFCVGHREANRRKAKFLQTSETFIVISVL